MNIRFFIVFCLLSCFATGSHGQNSKNIDSLQTVLAATFGSNRIEPLYELSWSYIDIDNAQALHYALEGYHLSNGCGDSLHIVRTGLVMASALRRTGRHDSAAVVYAKILPIAERQVYVSELTVGLNSAGITLTHKGDYDEALAHYFKSLELRKSAGDIAAQLVVLNNIGTVYYKLKNYGKALEIFLGCLKLHATSGLKEGSAVASINAGHACAYLGKYDSALYYLDLGIKLCDTGCVPARYMEVAFAKGVVYFGLQNLAKAEESFKRSYSLAQSEKDIRFQLDNIDYLSRIGMQRGDYGSAYVYLSAGEGLLREYPSFKLEASKLFSRFSELYHHTRRFERAYYYQLKYAAMSDEVYSADLTRNLMRIEADHLERENLAKISSQEELLALKESELASQQLTNRLVVLLALLSVAFAIVLYRNYRQKLRISTLLSDKIGEKTRQFQENAENLLKLSQERDTLLTRRSQVFADFLCRVKSLCLMGLKETPDPVGRFYILKIDSLTQEFDPKKGERRSSDA